MANTKKFNLGLTVLLSLIFAVVGFIAGLISPLYFAENYFTENLYTDETEHIEVHGLSVDDADISIHFPELGNAYTGDCVLIKVNDTEVLIDCGSRADSIATVSAYLDNYVKDGTLEYVIVTHAHQDHYAGFATAVNVNGIFDLYDCRTIITFTQTNQSPTGKMYSNFVRELNDEVENGATHYTSYDCYNNLNGAKRNFNLGKGFNMEILYNYYDDHDATTENDYSVCCLISGNGKNFLFTGDLEKGGEDKLAERFVIDHPEINVDTFRVDLYKAGHHGSKTSSNVNMLNVFKPINVCVCCCAGSSEYTETPKNQFPTQDFIDRISVWTKNVYVTTLCVDYSKKEFTSFNGNITVVVIGDLLEVKCSDNNLKLYQTEWFINNRVIPSAWTS